MSQRKLLEVGSTYGRWTVLENLPSTKKYTRVLCKCSCEKETIRSVIKATLIDGKSKSCGCLIIENSKKTNKTHGLTKSPTYKSWIALRKRCTDIKNNYFKDYGGRGIYVCERWFNSFENFLEDIGHKPSKEYTLDRINNDGPYSPENCRWATLTEQGRNKSTNRLITLYGHTKCVASWAEIFNLKKQLIYTRLNSGWTPEMALFKPKEYRKERKIKTNETATTNGSCL